MAQMTILTYTIEKSNNISGKGYENLVLLTLGDGAATYGTGVALSASSLGLPAGVIDGIFFEGITNTGNFARFDKSGVKLRLHEVDTTGDADKPAPELDSGDTPAAMTIRCLVKGY